jgi:hypothetical protein
VLFSGVEDAGQPLLLLDDCRIEEEPPSRTLRRDGRKVLGHGPRHWLIRGGLSEGTSRSKPDAAQGGGGAHAVEKLASA